jgi:hypothetical protein
MVAGAIVLGALFALGAATLFEQNGGTLSPQTSGSSGVVPSANLFLNYPAFSIPSVTPDQTKMPQGIF